MMRGYFLFHHGPQWAPKYHFADSTTTVLANSSKKARVELCVMKSHIRKQSLRKILSFLMWRYFFFHHGPLWAPKYHFAEYTTRVLETVPWRKGCNSVWWSHTSESNLSESFSVVIMWGHFLLDHGPLWAPKYHFAESMRTVLANGSKKGRVELSDEVTHQKAISQKASL